MKNIFDNIYKNILEVREIGICRSNLLVQVDCKISKCMQDEYMVNIRLSQKFLSLYKEIVDAQHFLFYIIPLNYCSILILFYWNKMDYTQ